MIIFLGWPVEPVVPAKKGIISDFTFLAGNRATEQGAQPIQGKPI